MCGGRPPFLSRGTTIPKVQVGSTSCTVLGSPLAGNIVHQFTKIRGCRLGSVGLFAGFVSRSVVVFLCIFVSVFSARLSHRIITLRSISEAMGTNLGNIYLRGKQ